MVDDRIVGLVVMMLREGRGNRWLEDEVLARAIVALVVMETSREAEARG